MPLKVVFCSFLKENFGHVQGNALDPHITPPTQYNLLPSALQEDLQLSRNVLVYRVGTQPSMALATCCCDYLSISSSLSSKTSKTHSLRLKDSRPPSRWFQKSHLAIQLPTRRSNPTSPRLSGPAAMRHKPAPQGGHNFFNPQADAADFDAV
jgi:hypothetical protein